MQYSVFSRFQGCLWGMALGEQFGAYITTLAHEVSGVRSHQPETVPLQHWRPGVGGKTAQPLSHIVVQVLESLLQSQTGNFSGVQSLNWATLPNSSSGILAIVALPITLLFHDDLNLQRQALWQLMDTVQASEESAYAGTVYAYAIAQALKGQLNPRLLIDQTQAYLRVTVPDSTPVFHDLLSQLEQIQRLQASEIDLSTAIETLQTQPYTTDASIAIALYCFLQTPDFFQLSLLQAAQVKNNYIPICALTAALSGTYNSVAGIPAAWSATALDPSESSLLEQIRQNTVRLMALWSGIYDASNITEVDPLAVAAPWVLRLG